MQMENCNPEQKSRLSKDKKSLFSFLSSKRHNTELEALYRTYRDRFIALIHKQYGRTIEEQDLIDIYQDSFIALYEKIRDEQLTPDNLTVSLETYLFAIGKNKLYNYFRSHKDIESMLPVMVDLLSDVDPEPEILPVNTIVRQAVFELGNPCSRILLLFYYAKKNLKEIAQIAGYKSEQVAKNKRLSCVRLLKSIILKKYSKEDFF